MTDTKVITVLNCHLCGQDHPALVFRRYHNPMGDSGEFHDYWGVCPVTSEVILSQYPVLEEVQP